MCIVTMVSVLVCISKRQCESVTIGIFTKFGIWCPVICSLFLDLFDARICDLAWQNHLVGVLMFDLACEKELCHGHGVAE